MNKLYGSIAVIFCYHIKGMYCTFYSLQTFFNGIIWQANHKIFINCANANFYCDDKCIYTKQRFGTVLPARIIKLKNEWDVILFWE